MLFLVNQVKKELVMEQNVGIKTFSCLKIIIWHNLEDEAEYSSEELGCILVVRTDLCWVDFLVDKMHNVHLEIHKLTINGVFSWRMEMELLSMEISLWDMLVKKTDSSSGEVVLRGQIVVRLLCLFDREEERLD